MVCIIYLDVNEVFKIKYKHFIKIDISYREAERCNPYSKSVIAQHKLVS